MKSKTLKQIHTLYVQGNYACFINGFGNKKKDFEVRIPLNEITDNIDYFVEKRIKFINEHNLRLTEEKNNLKKWKSVS